MKIGTKLLLIMITLTALLTAVSLSGLLSSSRLLEDEMKDKYLAVSSYAMEKIHRLFLGRYQDVRMLAAEPVLSSRHSTPRQITEKLREFKKHFKSYIPYESLSFFEMRSRVRIADTEGYDIGVPHSRTAYWNDIENGNEFALDISKAQSTGELVFHFAQVVRDRRGVPFGLVVGRIPVEALHDIVNRPLRLFKVDTAFDVDLLDRNGLILYSNYNKQGMLEQTSPAWDLVKQVKLSDARNGTVPFENPERHREEILFFAREGRDATFEGNDWTLLIALPKQIALAPILNLRNRLVLVIAAVVLCAIGAGIALSKTITKPIVRLSTAVADVGQGNLDGTVKITSHDEIGQLTEGFNTMVTQLKDLHRELKTMAVVDPLTGAFNRNKIDQVLDAEIQRSARYGSALSLLLFDLDHFKSINDTYGHQSGDYVLKVVIGIIQSHIRTSDSLGRWGGEEFILVAPGTDREQATSLAEKIRQHILNNEYKDVGTITISCGVAQFRPGDTGDRLIKRADEALYRAKRMGRNRVESCQSCIA